MKLIKIKKSFFILILCKNFRQTTNFEEVWYWASRKVDILEWWYFSWSSKNLFDQGDCLMHSKISVLSLIIGQVISSIGSCLGLFWRMSSSSSSWVGHQLFGSLVCPISEWERLLYLLRSAVVRCDISHPFWCNNFYNHALLPKIFHTIFIFKWKLQFLFYLSMGFSPTIYLLGLRFLNNLLSIFWWSLVWFLCGDCTSLLCLGLCLGILLGFQFLFLLPIMRAILVTWCLDHPRLRIQFLGC